MIAKDCFRQINVFTVGLEAGREAMPVFSSEEEAEMFLWLQTTEDGWTVRETSPGQLTSVLYGPCADAEKVMLDPLSEIGAGEQVGLVSIDRESFLERILVGKVTAT